MVTLIRYKVSKQKVSKVIDNVSKRTISMLAKELSVNVETIRFYERKGLIKQPPKPMQGYRHYPKETGPELCLTFPQLTKKVGTCNPHAAIVL